MRKAACFTIVLYSLTWAQSAVPVIGLASKGNGGPAAGAPLEGPAGFAEDSAGNIYIAERNAGAIRRVRPDGVIEHFAGAGATLDGAFLGENTPRLNTFMVDPAVLLADRDGGLIYSDYAACRIRRIAANGNVTTLAGTGVCGFNGDNRPGPQTQIRPAVGLALDAQGRLVFADSDNNRIRQLQGDGTVRTIAGNGNLQIGVENGQALQSPFAYPQGLAYDREGNLYIAEWAACRVRRLSTNGLLTTVAGYRGGATPCSNPSVYVETGSAEALLGNMYQLAFESSTNSILATSPGLRRVFRIRLGTVAAGQPAVSSILGNGAVSGNDTSDPASRSLASVFGVFASSRQGVLVSDAAAWQVYRIGEGRVTTFAGRWPQLSGNYPSPASHILLQPMSLAAIPAGGILLAESGANRILKYEADQLTAVAGSRSPQCCNATEGANGLQTPLGTPRRVAFSQGRTYVLEAASRRLLQISESGAIRVLGQNQTGGIGVDSSGNIYTATVRTGPIYEIVRWNASTLIPTVIAGGAPAANRGDNGPAIGAGIEDPGGIAFDSKGNLYFAERGLAGRIRRITPDGVISTVAGNGQFYLGGEFSGKLPLETALPVVQDLAIDRFDNLAWTSIGSVFTVPLSENGKIRVLAGNTGAGSVDGTLYSSIAAVAFDSEGNLYFSTQFGSTQAGNSLELGARVYRIEASNLVVVPPTAAITAVKGVGEEAVRTLGAFRIEGNLLAAGSSPAESDAPALELGGVSVRFGDQPARLFRVSPTLIEGIVPAGVDPGKVLVTVTPGGAIQPGSREIDVESAGPPRLFGPSARAFRGKQYVHASYGDDQRYAHGPQALDANRLFRVASPGETVWVSFTGMGSAASEATVYLGELTAPATVESSEPGGLMRLRFVVPESAPAGDVPISVVVDGQPAAEQEIYLAVAAVRGRVLARTGFEEPQIRAGRELAGQDGWVDRGGNRASVTVAPDFARTGSQSVRLLPSPATANAGAGASFLFSNPSPMAEGRRVVVSVDMFREKGAATLQSGLFLPSTTAGAVQASALLNWLSDDRLQVAGSTTLTLPASPPDRWLGMTLVCDFRSRTFDMFVNGVRIAERRPLATSAVIDGTVRGGFISSPLLNAGTGFFDNFRIEILPEEVE